MFPSIKTAPKNVLNTYNRTHSNMQRMLFTVDAAL
jgi:hypothetical protein